MEVVITGKISRKHQFYFPQSAQWERLSELGALRVAGHALYRFTSRSSVCYLSIYHSLGTYKHSVEPGTGVSAQVLLAALHESV